MQPVGGTAPANACEPRCADGQLVYRVVAAELDGFLAEAERRGHPLPSFVQSTFRDFLTCGVLQHGFIRVLCDQCGRDRVVAFSCTRRGICNSCGGRRMAETAAHLVDDVLPAVPTRQWVLSPPFLQRFDGALNLNVHFHSLVLDGVYEVLPNSRGVRFLELGPPDRRQVEPDPPVRSLGMWLGTWPVYGRSLIRREFEG